MNQFGRRQTIRPATYQQQHVEVRVNHQWPQPGRPATTNSLERTRRVANQGIAA